MSRTRRTDEELHHGDAAEAAPVRPVARRREPGAGAAERHEVQRREARAAHEGQVVLREALPGEHGGGHDNRVTRALAK
jgi:hypothetical protein